jgi:hypothetical protein
VGAFAREIEKELSWREGELASLRLSLHAAGRTPQAQLVLLRAAWTLLYAHYEGFAKYIWERYLQEISSTHLPRCLFKSEIARFSLEAAFRKLRKDGSSSSFCEFGESFSTRVATDPIGFDVQPSTNSNLWPDLLKKNWEFLSLPADWVVQYHSELWLLVDRRNNIAHGQKLEIKNLEEYRRFEQAVLMVMYTMALTVIESVEEHTYLKKPPCMAISMGIP